MRCDLAAQNSKLGISVNSNGGTVHTLNSTATLAVLQSRKPALHDQCIVCGLELLAVQIDDDLLVRRDGHRSINMPVERDNVSFLVGLVVVVSHIGQGSGDAVVVLRLASALLHGHHTCGCRGRFARNGCGLLRRRGVDSLGAIGIALDIVIRPFRNR